MKFSLRQGIAGTAMVLAVMLSPADAGAQSKTELFSRVENELKTEQLSESTISALQSLISKDPNDADAYLYLGLALDRMGLGEQAQDCFAMAVAKGVKGPDSLIALCKQEIKAGRPEVASALLNEGLKKFPENAEMLHLMGTYFLQHNHVKQAASFLRKAYMIDPNIFGLPTHYGQCFLQSDPKKTVQLSTLDLKRDPNYYQGLRVRGLAYKFLGQYAKAVDDLVPLFRKDPADLLVSRSLSDCYYWLGRYDGALKPSIFVVASTSLDDVEDSGNIEVLTRLIPKVPENRLIEEIDKVVEWMSHMLPKPAFHYQLGRALDTCGKHRLANQQYQAAIKLDPSYVTAYYRLGLNQELYTGEYESALRNYSIAHNFRPHDDKINIAFMRLNERLHNKSGDFSWEVKRWFQHMFN